MKPRRSSRGRSRSDSASYLGFEKLEARLPLDASMLRITEFVASNDNGLLDYDGDSSDWMEIYNSGTQAVNLEGLHLTDTPQNLSRWTFPAGLTLEAGGYLVVFASSKNTVKPNGEVHTNFGLSAGGEFTALVDTDGTTIIDQYAPEYPPQFEDISYGVAMVPDGGSTTLLADGAIGKAWRPTSGAYDAIWKGIDFDDSFFNIQGPSGFGYENSPGDSTNYTAEIGTSVPAGTTSLYVRMPFNLAALSGIDRLTLRMRYDDGFVAYLNGVRVAEGLAPEVSQWNSVATSNHDDSLAEQFEEFDISSFISALEVGENVLAVHALNVSSGSSDFLISPELVATSASIAIPAAYGFFEEPTPGYANGETNYAGFLAEPTFSVPHGFYDTPQSVSIESSTPSTTIVYTTNGSTPSVNSDLTVSNGILYTGPINVSGTTTLRAAVFREDYKPSFVAASSYLFTGDIIQQSPLGQAPAGWPRSGLNGQELDYGIDPDILALYGQQAVKDSLTSIPSISITTDLANLFDAATGIYVNATNRGRPWERPASVELVYPDGQEGITVNAGLRIRGGYSRNDFNPKHAFRFYFRGDYGDSRLEYPLFGDEGPAEFDVLDLRTAQNYSWSSEGNNQNSFVREVFARDLMADLNEPYTRSRYYHLYLDGVYWGLFMTQERVEEFYGETYFGGDESDYDVVKSGLGDVGGTELSAGNDLAWRQLFDLGQGLSTNYAQNADNYWTMQGLNPDGTRNPDLPVLLDVDNLITFNLIVFFTGGYDTGISQFLGNDRANNWFGIYNRVSADQGFQFFVHDNEHSLGAGNPTHSTLNIDRTGPFNAGNQNNYAQANPQYLHQDLLVHPEYRQRFVDYVQREFFNDGAFTLSENLERISERIAQVDPAIIAEAARWGDAQRSVPANKSTWQAEINWLLNNYFPARNAIVLNQLRNDSLFTYFNAPSFNQHGGEIESGFLLSMVASAGTIYYTTDGETDPRLIGGDLNPASEVKLYTGAFPLTENVTVRARLRTDGGVWSGLVEADFFLQPHSGDFNGDGSVDGRDFLYWQRNFGAAADPAGSGADGNADGTVNVADLTVWDQNYGFSSSVSQPTASAESDTFASLLFADDEWIDSAFLAAKSPPRSELEDGEVAAGGEPWSVNSQPDDTLPNEILPSPSDSYFTATEELDSAYESSSLDELEDPFELGVVSLL